MTKSDQIRMRIDAGYSNRQIVKATGYSPDYVRAVRGRYERPEVEAAWYQRYKQSEQYKAKRREIAARHRERNREHYNAYNLARYHYKRKQMADESA